LRLEKVIAFKTMCGFLAHPVVLLYCYTR